jgi:hypothetical protein
MVSVGERTHLTDVSFPRVTYWASRHKYNSILINIPLQPENRSPHYGKLAAPKFFPGFDIYCIVDDDLLISRLAPKLPDIIPGKIGIVRDEVQTKNGNSDFTEWNANTGFMIVHKDAVVYLESAIDHGNEPKLPGPYDQGALNYVGWQKDIFQEIDIKWNFQMINHFIINYKNWKYWDKNILNRIKYFINIKFNLLSKQRKLIKNSYGVHLIKNRFTKYTDSIIP